MTPPMTPDRLLSRTLQTARHTTHYRASEPYFHLSGAWKGAKITQPSFFMGGKADGLKALYPLGEEQLRAGLPGLVGFVELDNVGHWVQHEASTEVSEQLLGFLQKVSPRQNGSP